MDFGPIYAETDMARFPVEPWNTASNLVFAFILVRFAMRTHLSFRNHPLIVAGLPILLVGFIGGTVFHAARSANLWLFLDFVPILILALLAAVFFWTELLGSAWYAGAASAVLFVILGSIRRALDLPRHLAISLGYGCTAVMILLPAFLLVKRDRWRGGGLLLGALTSFAAALVFRVIDAGAGQRLFPMGTHFLWHLFGGASVYYLMEFVFRRDAAMLTNRAVNT